MVSLQAYAQRVPNMVFVKDIARYGTIIPVDHDANCLITPTVVAIAISSSPKNIVSIFVRKKSSASLLIYQNNRYTYIQK